jgi:hypothetical protein
MRICMNKHVINHKPYGMNGRTGSTPLFAYLSATTG